MFFRRPSPSLNYAAATPVRRKPSLDFSVIGLVYCSMMLFMGVAAINSQANLLFGVFGLMIGILLVSGVVSRVVLRRLRVRRVLPDHGCVGQKASITYEITNTKRFWPSLSVSLAELDGVEAFTTQTQCYMLHAAPGMTASVPAEVTPKRRGLHELNRFQISTSFPFGFVKRAIVERHKEVLLVFPALGQVDDKLLALCRSAETSGSTLRPSPGGADEFYGVKEFRTGDNPRWIYWRRSAKTKTLVSRQMTRVSPPRILILVDTFLGDRSPDEHSAVERAIAMAASLADSALEQGLSVGLSAWSGSWVAVTPTRGKRHRADLLSILARLPLNTGHGVDELIEQGQQVLESGTTPVLFSPREGQVSSIGRGTGIVIVPARSTKADAWFRFNGNVDFLASVPADQQPDGREQARRHEGTKARRVEAG
jgi:uncharacterized protein (DUF58 family)